MDNCYNYFGGARNKGASGSPEVASECPEVTSGERNNYYGEIISTISSLSTT